MLSSNSLNIVFSSHIDITIRVMLHSQLILQLIILTLDFSEPYVRPSCDSPKSRVRIVGCGCDIFVTPILINETVLHVHLKCFKKCYTHNQF